MEDNLKLFIESTKQFSEKEKMTVEKHYGMVGFIYSDTAKVLEEYKIDCSKGRELILLTISPMNMRRTLELAKNMGFLKAFQDKPERLRQSITSIIKRIAKCEAEGISYITNDNSFGDFLFREKLFVQKMEELNKNYVEEKEVSQEEVQTDLGVVLNVADALYEACPEIDEPKQNVMAAVQYSLNNDKLGPKEVLLKVFSQYADAKELNSKIDNILGISEEQTEGSRAA